MLLAAIDGNPLEEVAHPGHPSVHRGVLHKATHLVHGLLDELLRERHRLLDALDLLELNRGLAKLGCNLIDLERDPLGGIRSGGPESSPKVGVLLLEASDSGLSALEVRLVPLALKADVFVDDIDHLANGLRRDEVVANEVDHARIELVDADMRPAAAGSAPVAAVRARVRAGHAAAAGATQDVSEDVATGVALRCQAILSTSAEQVLDAVPELLGDDRLHLARNDLVGRIATALPAVLSLDPCLAVEDLHAPVVRIGYLPPGTAIGRSRWSGPCHLGLTAGDIISEMAEMSPIERPADPPIAAKLFRGLADPARLALLTALRRGPCRAGGLALEVSLSPSNASNHLACLLECGLVEVDVNGRQNVYRLRDPRVAELLDAADALLGVVGAAVEACLNYGPPSRRALRREQVNVVELPTA